MIKKIKAIQSKIKILKPGRDTPERSAGLLAPGF